MPDSVIHCAPGFSDAVVQTGDSTPSVSSVRDELSNWTPASWRHKPAMHQPIYPDHDAETRVLIQLQDLPPLVTSWEVLALKHRLAEAATGRCFLLQGGDCAERFAECTAPLISKSL